MADSSAQVQSFAWVTNNKNQVYRYYKVSLALYLCSMSFYGWRDQKLNPKNVHGEEMTKNETCIELSQGRIATLITCQTGPISFVHCGEQFRPIMPFGLMMLEFIN